MGKKGLFLLLVLLGCLSCFGQQNKSSNVSKPRLRFMQDSVMLGQPLKAQLIYEHDKDLEVLFPDSSFDFGTFEFYQRQTYTTFTEDSISSDCTIYEFQTFELDPVQTLQMNVLIFTKNDSFFVKSNYDTVRLVEVVQQFSDTTSLKETTNFEEVDLEVNYPYILIGLGIVAVAVLLGILLFGQSFWKKWRIYRLKKKHEQFEMEFSQFGNSPKETENAIGFWKRYLTSLEKTDIESLTTKEIQAQFNDESLSGMLSEMDGYIFGGIAISKDASLSKLSSFAYQRLQKRIKTIQDGGEK